VSSGRGAGSLALQRAVLGAPTASERASRLVALLLLVGFATRPLHGLDPAWIGVAAVVLLAVAGVLTAETLRTVNWDFALMFGMLAGMADVVAGTGLDRWLAGLAQQALGQLCAAPVLFVVGLAVTCFVTHQPVYRTIDVSPTNGLRNSIPGERAWRSILGWYHHVRDGRWGNATDHRRWRATVIRGARRRAEPAGRGWPRGVSCR